MSDFSVPIVRIADVLDHPNADRLSINKVLGFDCITRKNDDGSHKFRTSSLVVYVPEDAIVPEYILKAEGFWDLEKDIGMLAGSKGNRVKCVKLREIYSQGILLPVHRAPRGISAEISHYVDGLNGPAVLPIGGISEGDDVADLLGITKRVIVIPANMAGDVFACESCVRYDFDSLQKQPDLFAEGEEVEVTEKLHGTFCNIGIVPGKSWPEAFGADRNIYITSKGQGAEGRALINNDKNVAKNVYVKTLLANNVPFNLEHVSNENDDAAIRVFGEVFGSGVQDLSYGTNAPEFCVFDIKLNDRFLFPDDVRDMANQIGLTSVPVLYRGPFSMAKMIELRDGKDTISGSHIREGIVIRAAGGKRKIAKLVSPQYLTRKGSVTEYQ